MAASQRRRQEPCGERLGPRPRVRRQPTSRPPRHAHSRAHRYDWCGRHSGAELRRIDGYLVTREPELPLELGQATFRGSAWRQVGGPEPGGHGVWLALHDRPTVSPV